MENLTLISIHASYLLGMGIFLLAAGGRYLIDGLILPPAIPRLARGSVPTWFYRYADLFGILLFITLFYSMAVSNAQISEQTNAEISVQSIAVSVLIQFFMPGVAFAIVAQRVGIVEWLGLRWKEWPHAFWISVFGVFTMMIFGMVLQLLGYQEALEALGAADEQDVVKMFREETNPFLLALVSITAVVVAPICEEIVFRGYIYPAAKKFTGSTMAALFSALVFAGAHGNIAALIPLFIFGLLLVAVYEKTGSIWAPMAVHALFNGSTVALQFLARYADVHNIVAK